MLITLSLLMSPWLQEPAVEERTVAEWNQLGIERLAADEWSPAIDAFQWAIKLDPQEEQLRINLARAFTSRGVHHERSQCLPLALSDYQTAAKTHRDGGSGESMLARLLVRLGKRQDAFDLCESLRESFPGNTDGWLVAAEILRLRAHPAQALELLDSAKDIEDGPDISNATWQSSRKKLAAEAKMFAGFQRINSGHFVVLFDAASEHSLTHAPMVVAELESACAELSARFGILPTETLTAIVSGREQMGADAPEWSAAVFDGRIRLAIGPNPRIEAVRKTLRHEYMHALLHTLGTEIPTWFHEGLAQIAEDMQWLLGSKNQVAGGLDSLQGDWVSWTDEKKVRNAYAYSFRFCTWLSDKNGETLWSLLFTEIRNWGFDEGFKKVLGFSPSETEKLFLVENNW